MGCQHKWYLVTKETLESPGEKMLRLARENGYAYKAQGYGLSSQFSTKVVIIIACEKCGKIKKFVEENK
jgi:hypothetical protein